MSKQERNLVHIIGDPRVPAARALSGGSGGGDNGDMDTRLKALESTMVTVVERLDTVETRLEYMPTKAELEALRTDVYQAIGVQTWRLIGSATILVAGVYYIARYVQ